MHWWAEPNNPDDKWKHIGTKLSLGNQWESQQVFNLRVDGGDSLLAWLVALFLIKEVKKKNGMLIKLLDQS